MYQYIKKIGAVTSVILPMLMPIHAYAVPNIIRCVRETRVINIEAENEKDANAGLVEKLVINGIVEDSNLDTLECIKTAIERNPDHQFNYKRTIFPGNYSFALTIN